MNLVQQTRYINKVKLPVTEKWIKNLWYMYTIKYYTFLKENKIMQFEARGIDYGYHSE